MKVDWNIIFMCGFIILLIGTLTFVGKGVIQSMEDRMVFQCLSEGDISNSYQQKFCLKIMEKLDYDSKGDYRQDLYDTIKSTLIINQTKYEEVKREWCFVSWDKEGNLYCNAELISYRGNKTK